LERSKLLYRGFSLLKFGWFWLLRLAVSVAIFYSLASFEENPVVISIFVFLCLMFIVFLGDDQISVYSDKIVHSTNSLYSLIAQSEGEVYEIGSIRRAYLPSNSVSATDAGIILVLAMITPQRAGSRSHPLFLEMTNGETKRLGTYLGYAERKKLVEVINSRIAEISASRSGLDRAYR
jgi:hypothetical protein